MSDYILQTGEEGVERLDAVEVLFGAASREFLVAAGLRAGARVLDVGCGTGTLTTWMAEVVGPKGHVTGVDAEPRQLSIARARAEAKGLARCDFRACRVGHDPLPGGFDIVHCRLLLMHLTDVAVALDAMSKALCEGGILACEETSASSVFTSPACGPIDRMNDIFRSMGHARGLDFDIGDRLFAELSTRGARVLASRFVQPIVPIAAAKRLTGLSAIEVRPVLIASGALGEAEADALMASLRAVPDEPGAYYAPGRLAQVAVALA